METEDGNVIIESCVGGEELLRDFIPSRDLQEAKEYCMDIVGIKRGSKWFEEVFKKRLTDICAKREKQTKEAIEETYVELRNSAPYNSGHLQSAIVIRTDGKQSPIYHEVVFSNKIWESNEPAPLTKNKVFYDGSGNMVLGPKRKPYKKKAGYTWEPRVDKYDYRKNDEVRTPDGSIYDEAYVDEYYEKKRKAAWKGN